MSEAQTGREIKLLEIYSAVQEKKHLIVSSVLYENGRTGIPLDPDNDLFVPIVEDDTLPDGGEGLYISTTGAWCSRSGQFYDQGDSKTLPEIVMRHYAMVADPVCQQYDRDAWEQIDLTPIEIDEKSDPGLAILAYRDSLISAYVEKSRMELAQNLDSDLGRVLESLQSK